MGGPACGEHTVLVRGTMAASYRWDTVWVQRQRESGRRIHQGPGHQGGGVGAPPLQEGPASPGVSVGLAQLLPAHLSFWKPRRRENRCFALQP